MINTAEYKKNLADCEKWGRWSRNGRHWATVGFAGMLIGWIGGYDAIWWAGTTIAYIATAIGFLYARTKWGRAIKRLEKISTPPAP